MRSLLLALSLAACGAPVIEPGCHEVTGTVVSSDWLAASGAIMGPSKWTLTESQGIYTLYRHGARWKFVGLAEEQQLHLSNDTDGDGWFNRIDVTLRRTADGFVGGWVSVYRADDDRMIKKEAITLEGVHCD